MAEISQNQIDNLASMLDGYVAKGGHHLNVNILRNVHLMECTCFHIRLCNKVCESLYLIESSTFTSGYVIYITYHYYRQTLLVPACFLHIVFILFSLLFWYK